MAFLAAELSELQEALEHQQQAVAGLEQRENETLALLQQAQAGVPVATLAQALTRNATVTLCSAQPSLWCACSALQHVDGTTLAGISSASCLQAGMQSVNFSSMDGGRAWQRSAAIEHVGSVAVWRAEAEEGQVPLTDVAGLHAFSTQVAGWNSLALSRLLSSESVGASLCVPVGAARSTAPHPSVWSADVQMEGSSEAVLAPTVHRTLAGSLAFDRAGALVSLLHGSNGSHVNLAPSAELQRALRHSGVRPP